METKKSKQRNKLGGCDNDNPERACPILSLCNAVFTDQVTFSISFEHFFSRKWKQRVYYSVQVKRKQRPVGLE